MNKHGVIFIMGPTCSGKTALAISLAQVFPMALINVDSAQVYRRMNIGTAKPDPQSLKAYPHALLDICEPTVPYNAADFCVDASDAIRSALAQGKTPLLVGGTMMYFHALEQGLSTLPESDPQIRAAIAAEAQVQGWPALHECLAAQDPLSAAKIKPHDAQRISRALEVYRMTGQPMSELQGQSGEPFVYPRLIIGLMPGDRARLHADIAQRFDEMLAAGFLEEAKQLFAEPGIHAGLPAIKSVGYRQAWEYLRGDYDEAVFREKAIAATRQLAKRQMTWLRSWKDCIFYNPYEPAELARLKEEVAIFLSKICYDSSR